ncbi:hypothetical protein, partial [Streptomyces sp. NPDC057509]|uniref:hypothetical protein n=1 Tax=Streptomyces sp. NPDC057509 TaxID=3346152 RepID=UPI0036760B61
ANLLVRAGPRAFSGDPRPVVSPRIKRPEALERVAEPEPQAARTPAPVDCFTSLSKIFEI